MNPVESFNRCRTPADFYQVQIDLENTCVPSEIVALREKSKTLPAPARRWLDGLEVMMRRGSATVQPFRRLPLSDNVWYFQTGAPPEAKSLLVGFCGNALRLMLPIPVFLQHVPARDFDVVVLRDPSRCFYLRGVPEYAPHLAEVVARLQRDLPCERYSTVRCLGTSGGGAAALVAGTLLGAERALSVGGTHPARLATMLGPSGLKGDEMDALIASLGTTATQRICCFGADNASDAEGAHSLCRALPGARAEPAAGVASHNLLLQLFERGALHAFLETRLLEGAVLQSRAERGIGPSPPGLREDQVESPGRDFFDCRSFIGKMRRLVSRVRLSLGR